MIKIKKANVADKEKIYQIASKAWKLDRYHVEKGLDREKADRFWAEVAVKNFDDPDTVTFVAEANKKIVGFIQVKINKDLSEFWGLKWGTICLVGVDPDAQAKGIGKTLLKKAIRWFKKMGCKKVDVSTDINNIGALKMYTSQGFYIVHTSATLTLDL